MEAVTLTLAYKRQRKTRYDPTGMTPLLNILGVPPNLYRGVGHHSANFWKRNGHQLPQLKEAFRKYYIKKIKMVQPRELTDGEEEAIKVNSTWDKIEHKMDYRMKYSRLSGLTIIERYTLECHILPSDLIVNEPAANIGKPVEEIDWSLVDWSKNNRHIAESLGVYQQRVKCARQKLAPNVAYARVRER